MNREHWLPLVVGVTLVGILATAAALWKFQEAGRPELLEARIVTASSLDPVFREGPRTLAPGEEPLAAVAVKIRRRNDEGTWLAPVSTLLLDGKQVEHIETDTWPEEDRFIRVFWFTVECDHMGGELRSENAGALINYRSFLAPELGRGLKATLEDIEAHNDDQVTPEDGAIEVTAGAFRLYCRVEIVERPRSIAAMQSVTTTSPNDLLNETAPSLAKHLDAPSGINPAVGELFLLPGFEPAEDIDVDSTLLEPVGKTVSELVKARIVTTSEAVANLAISGETNPVRPSYEQLGQVLCRENTYLRNGKVLHWGRDIKAGDMLVHETHWLIIYSDNGNSVLDGEDLVLHSWRRPPAVLPLAKALEQNETLLQLKRHDG